MLSDGGLRRSEAVALTWGDVQRWDDGSGRITVIRSKTDVEAAGDVVAVTPAAMRALDAIRPAGVARKEKVFGLSESQIARRVKAVARAAGLPDWENFSGHAGGWAWPAAWPRTALPLTRSSARAAGNRAAAWSDATPAASPQARRCGICNGYCSSRHQLNYSGSDRRTSAELRKPSTGDQTRARGVLCRRRSRSALAHL